MSRRVFAVIRRGPMDNTAVCIYPWELLILQHIHMQEVKEVSIDDMATQRDGVIKVEKLKLKHTQHPAPDLRQQLEAMAWVNPEEDPALDPATEYQRLTDKYGMDKDFPVPVVERIFGQYAEGCAFEAKLKQYKNETMTKPAHLRASDEGLDRSPKDMKVGELREALKERGIAWKVTEGQAALAAKLEAALAPA